MTTYYIAFTINKIHFAGQERVNRQVIAYGDSPTENIEISPCDEIEKFSDYSEYSKRIMEFRHAPSPEVIQQVE